MHSIPLGKDCGWGSLHLRTQRGQLNIDVILFTTAYVGLSKQQCQERAGEPSSAGLDGPFLLNRNTSQYAAYAGYSKELGQYSVSRGTPVCLE